MSTIDYSISLTKQPAWTKYKEKPSAKDMENTTIAVDNSEYEEYSYTGKYSEAVNQRNREINEASSIPLSPSYKWTGLQVQTTLTRLNGDLWELKVRKNRLYAKAGTGDDENDHSDQEAQEAANGSESNPKQIATSIEAMQESILNHKKYDGIPPDNLAAIKMYMNGAGGSEKVGTSSGVRRLDELMHITDDLVQLAIKNPTYYVPSMTMTYSYWSPRRVQDMSGIGKPGSPPGAGTIWAPEDGYVSLLMGIDSEPKGSGYVIKKTYLIGKFNTEIYE